jgi:hypothetical protein
MPTSSQSQETKRPPGLARLDLRDLLLLGGAGQYAVDMSIPYMNFLPMTCEPYAQGVMQIVRGLQRLLNKRGANLTVDGGMGSSTLRELVKYAGPRWYDKSWSQLYLDVISGEQWPGWKRLSRQPGNLEPGAIAMSGFELNTQTVMIGGAIALGALYLFGKKRGRR